jgi:hypothetical protein
MIKVQFLLKYRAAYSPTDPSYPSYSDGYISSGLLNSARMVAAALEEFGINNEDVETELVQLNSYNLIDAELVRFNPDIVILEAFWVPPSKVAELVGLSRHSARRFIIRNHSNIPFLALEGTPISWIPQYCALARTSVATNSTDSLRDLRELVTQQMGITPAQAETKVIYFPNYYLIETTNDWVAPPLGKPHLDVGCFGAVRPLKNHVAQASAAISAARQLGKPLKFHINVTRTEFGGNASLQSLRSIFSGGGPDELIEHGWLEHDDFLLLIKQMDISMQVSFSETFNIVTADAVSGGVPVVVGPDISWVDKAFIADPTSGYDMAQKLLAAEQAGRRGLQNINLTGLQFQSRVNYERVEDTLDFVLQGGTDSSLPSLYVPPA